VSPLFNTVIIYVADDKIYEKICEDYENYDINKWKNIFYKSINIK